jgi:type IV pilus assembly protein PilB
MAEMDVNDRNRPAQGRLSMAIDGRSVDIRVSTLPARHGERIALRLLDRQSAYFSIDHLGFLPENKAAFRSLIERSHGLILVSGPGKSGRTTTLYAALNALNLAGHTPGGRRKTIVTCEESIEFEMDGICQSLVNPRAGISPPAHLEAILNQDPDVVMIGDLRDAATAEIACRAALRGCLVLASIDGSEAADAPGRLMAMGVPPYLVAAALAGIVSQRLVRKLCPACRREVVPGSDTISYFRCLNVKIPHVMRLHEPVGCDRCDQMGMRGRLAVQEILPADRHLQHLVTECAEVEMIRQSAVDSGMIPMITDGLNKVCHGLTTLREIQAQVGDGQGLRTLYAVA